MGLFQGGNKAFQLKISIGLSFQDDRSYSSDMARPRRSEQTRLDLINAGIEQLSVHGYHGTGIKQILDEVKVPKGSFYNFFASKEAFVGELIDHYSEQLLTQLTQFLDYTDGKYSPTQQLRAVFKVSMDRFALSQCQKTCLIGVMASELGRESELCQKALEVSVEQWMLVITRVIDSGQKGGEMRSDVEAAELASLYWSTWQGTLLKAKMSGDIIGATRTMDLLVDTLLKS